MRITSSWVNRKICISHATFVYKTPLQEVLVWAVILRGSTLYHNKLHINFLIVAVVVYSEALLQWRPVRTSRQEYAHWIMSGRILAPTSDRKTQRCNSQWVDILPHASSWTLNVAYVLRFSWGRLKSFFFFFGMIWYIHVVIHNRNDVPYVSPVIQHLNVIKKKKCWLQTCILHELVGSTLNCALFRLCKGCHYSIFSSIVIFCYKVTSACFGAIIGYSLTLLASFCRWYWQHFVHFM